MNCYIPNKLYKLWPLIVGVTGIGCAIMNMWGITSLLLIYLVYIALKRLEYYIPE